MGVGCLVLYCLIVLFNLQHFTLSYSYILLTVGFLCLGSLVVYLVAPPFGGCSIVVCGLSADFGCCLLCVCG